MYRFCNAGAFEGEIRGRYNASVLHAWRKDREVSRKFELLFHPREHSDTRGKNRIIYLFFLSLFTKKKKKDLILKFLSFIIYGTFFFLFLGRWTQRICSQFRYRGTRHR